MTEILLLSLTAALSPSLVAAVTAMLLSAHPLRLMLGYLGGALFSSIILGLVIVFALEGSGVTHTTKRTLSPAVDLALAAIFLALAVVLATGRDEPFEERHEERRADKGPPKWQQWLDRGTPRTTFVVGALLSFPGVSYLLALDRLGKLDYPAVVTILVLIGINLVMLVLLLIPIYAFFLAPQRTPEAIERATTWGRRHGRKLGVWVLTLAGVALAARGLTGLL